MKRGLLILLCWLSLGLSSYANDTLTRAQVYNFNVGDTFDYHIYGGGIDNPIPFSESYERQIIQDIYYSLASDTLFLVKRIAYPFPQLDTIFFTDLQSKEVYILPDTTMACQFIYSIDTNSVYNHRRTNRVEASCFEQYEINSFAEGLGKVYRYYNNEYHPPDLQYENTNELIYYSKGAERWGTPLFNSANLRHYTPLPEECAVWTDDIYCDFPPLSHNCLYIREQIHSGNKIPYQGHTYVEMIYRSYDFSNNYYTSDSLIGYYRNDTTNKKAIFYQSVSDTSFLEYDFDYPCPAPNCLTQVMVGGQLRTKWPDYIEGVGGNGGLVPVKNFTPYTPGSPTQYHSWGYLKTFCVCGQLLYSPDTTNSCALLTGINDIANSETILRISPNPATSQLNITVDESLIGAELNIYNTAGVLITTLPLNTAYCQLPTAAFPPGVYIAEIKTATGAQRVKWVKM